MSVVVGDSLLMIGEQTDKTVLEIPWVVSDGRTYERDVKSRSGNKYQAGSRSSE